MNLDVLVEIGFLSEAEVASLLRTHVGSLIGVDSQVVEKVVPLFELLSAFVTLENLDLSF